MRRLLCKRTNCRYGCQRLCVEDSGARSRSTTLHVVPQLWINSYPHCQLSGLCLLQVRLAEVEERETHFARQVDDGRAEVQHFRELSSSLQQQIESERRVASDRINGLCKQVSHCTVMHLDKFVGCSTSSCMTGLLLLCCWGTAGRATAANA